MLRTHPIDGWTYTDGVDVGLVAGERLSAHAFPDVPELGRGVAGARYKQLDVWPQRQAHDITGVAGECGRLLASFDVPESTAKRAAVTQKALSALHGG